MSSARSSHRSSTIYRDHDNRGKAIHLHIVRIRTIKMEKTIKGILMAATAGLFFTATTISPPSVADEVNTIPIEITPGPAICRQIIIEHYTPGSDIPPQREIRTWCGNKKPVSYYKTSHTHQRIISIRNFYPPHSY